jgi:hypothetical protein
MKRHVLRLVGIAALAGGGLLAFGTPGQAAPRNTCGNAVAIDSVAIVACHGGAFAITNGTWRWEWPGDDVDGGPVAVILSRTWS